jgi:hypothetical protein
MKKNRKASNKKELKLLKDAIRDNAKIANRPVEPVLSEEQIKYFASLNKPEIPFEPLKEYDIATDPSIRGSQVVSTQDDRLCESFADKLNKFEEISNGTALSYVDYKTLDLVFSNSRSQSIRIPLNLRNSILLVLQDKHKSTASRIIKQLLNSLGNDVVDKQKLVELVNSLCLDFDYVSIIVTKCPNKMQDVYSVYDKNSNCLLLELQIDWVKNKLSNKQVPISKPERQFIDSVFDGSLVDKRTVNRFHKT